MATAKHIVNDTFKDKTDSNNLVIGGYFFDLSDVISIKNKNYYVFYFKDKDQNAETSKRVLVDANTSEIYGNYVSNENKLIDIYDFIDNLASK